jgi:hypothetical protein
VSWVWFIQILVIIVVSSICIGGVVQGIINTISNKKGW